MIQERRGNPTDKQDLLNIMLNCEDKKTGKRLSDESIRYNVSADIPYDCLRKSDPLTLATGQLAYHDR